MKRRLFSLFTVVCVLMTLLVGQITYASSSSTPIKNDQVTIKAYPNGWLMGWESVTGTDHYEMSLRDLTTGDLVFFRQDNGTENTYKIPDDDLIYNHEYRFWVGAYNKAGDLLWQSTEENMPEFFFTYK